jgi:hypothetical protein
MDLTQLCVLVAVELDKEHWKQNLCGNSLRVQKDLVVDVEQSDKNLVDLQFRADIVRMFMEQMDLVNKHFQSTSAAK